MESWLVDGIIEATYKKHIKYITLEITKSVVEERIKATKGITRPLLIDMGQVAEIDKASRKYLSDGDGTRYLSATAIIVKDQITLFLARLFIMLDKPKIPTKFFINRNEARRWLSTFKNLN